MMQGVCDIEVRDAFLEFMSKTLQDYKKFFKDIHTANGEVPERVNSRDCFDFKKFRQLKDGLKPDSFIYQLTESSIFGRFIEARSLGQSQHDAQIVFFDAQLKQTRTKQNPHLIAPFKERKAVKTLQPTEEGLPCS